MAQKNHKKEDPEVVIQSAIGNTENFIMRNGRTLLIILAVIVVVVGGYFGYKYLVLGPRSQKASAMMYVAQQQFAADSITLALNGDGNFDGFLAVADKYGATPEGNLAKHYAGICYLKTGDYEKALTYLKKYKAVEGIPAEIVNAQNLGLQGDAYAELDNYKEAAAMYDKAVSASDNTLTAPYYLKKAGMAYEKLGDNANALKAYKKVAADYPASLEARDIQKYVGYLEQLQ